MSTITTIVAADKVGDSRTVINTNFSNLNTDKAEDSLVVHNTGSETIAGVKTLTSSPIVPTPTTDFQASTKKYVDDNAGGTPEGTAILSTGEVGGTKFLREDGDGTSSWQTVTAGSGDMVLADIQSVTGLKTFNKDKAAMKGTSTGVNTISVANTSATSYTNTIPAKTGTFAMTSDITGINSGTNTGDQDLSGLMVKANNLSDLTNTTTARTNLDVDVAGTDNSTDVTLAGTPSYLTIVGQVITRALINLTSHVTGTLPVANGGTGVTTSTGTGNTVLSNSPTLVTPALGTPSSGTLTNATGLPLTGLVDDTTTAIGVGSINIGHATDTTLSRVSAGVVAVEGNRLLDDTYRPTESFVIAISDETTAITTGTSKVKFRMPYAFTLTAVRASLSTASSSGLPTFDINETGTTILSTKLTIDATEKTSTTATTAAVISDGALADDAEITIDIDVAGTGAAGAKIYLIGNRT